MSVSLWLLPWVAQERVELLFMGKCLSAILAIFGFLLHYLQISSLLGRGTRGLPYMWGKRTYIDSQKCQDCSSANSLQAKYSTGSAPSLATGMRWAYHRVCNCFLNSWRIFSGHPSLILILTPLWLLLYPWGRVPVDSTIAGEDVFCNLISLSCVFFWGSV